MEVDGMYRTEDVDPSENCALVEARGSFASTTMFDKMITVLTRYRPNVLELI